MCNSGLAGGGLPHPADLFNGGGLSKCGAPKPRKSLMLCYTTTTHYSVQAMGAKSIVCGHFQDNGLKAVIEKKVADHVLNVHCYGHSLISFSLI